MAFINREKMYSPTKAPKILRPWLFIYIVILFIKCVLHTTVLVFKWSNLIGYNNDLVLIIFYDL